MSWFRVPARSLFLASTGTAVLAGFGVQALQQRLERADHWRQFATRLGKVVILATGFLFLLNRLCAPAAGVSLAEVVLPSRNVEATTSTEGVSSPSITPSLTSVERAWRATDRILHDPACLVTVAMLGLVVGLGFLRVRPKISAHAVHLLGLLALAELAWHGFALIQVAPAGILARPDPISESLILLDPALTEREPFRVRARDAFYLDLEATRYEIEKTNVNDVFQLGHAAALYGRLYPVATRLPPVPDVPMSQAVDDHRRQIRQCVFDRMAVAYLVSDRVEADPPWPVAATGSRDGKSYVIQRNPTALPRAYVVPRAEVFEDDPALVLSRFRSNDPRAAVLMSADPLANLPTGPRQPFTPARWLCRDPDRPVLDATTTAPGLLVIADTWMPGWSATVDGRAVPILRGNHAQRVIPLEHPGHHLVQLQYQPPGLVTGSAISALTILAWGVFSLVVVVRRRSGGPSDAKAGTPFACASGL